MRSGIFSQEDPMFSHPSYIYANANPINNTDPSGEITIPFVGWVDVGEAAGQRSAEWYAEKYNNSGLAGKVGWGTLGVLASLWTPCTSDTTLAVLSAGIGLQEYLGLRQPFWRYVGPNSKVNSPWLTRGWEAPYGRDFVTAKDKLQMPHLPNDVIKAKVPWHQPVRGPRPALKEDYSKLGWGSGGGQEWAKGWTWPK